MEERLISPDEAIEERDAFRLKGMFDQHVVIDGEYLNRVLARRLGKPARKKPVQKIRGKLGKVGRDYSRNRFADAFLKRFEVIRLEPGERVILTDGAQHHAQTGKDVLDIGRLTIDRALCLDGGPRSRILLAHLCCVLLAEGGQAGDSRDQRLGLSATVRDGDGARRPGAKEERDRFVVAR